MTITGGRTKQLDIFCRITGFTSDFLSFILLWNLFGSFTEPFNRDDTGPLNHNVGVNFLFLVGLVCQTDRKAVVSRITKDLTVA